MQVILLQTDTEILMGYTKERTHLSAISPVEVSIAVPNSLPVCTCTKFSSSSYAIQGSTLLHLLAAAARSAAEGILRMKVRNSMPNAVQGIFQGLGH